MSFPYAFRHPATRTSIRYPFTALDPQDVVEFANGVSRIRRMLILGRGCHWSTLGQLEGRIISKLVFRSVRVGMRWISLRLSFEIKILPSPIFSLVPKEVVRALNHSLRRNDSLRVNLGRIAVASDIFSP